MRCYRCREYDYFAAECPNTPTDEETDYEDKYRERSGDRYRYERGDRSRNIYKDEYTDRFCEIYRENDRKDSGKETYERNRRHNFRDRYFSVHDRWENLTVAIVDLLQVQNLVLT